MTQSRSSFDRLNEAGRHGSPEEEPLTPAWEVGVELAKWRCKQREFVAEGTE